MYIPELAFLESEKGDEINRRLCNMGSIFPHNYHWLELSETEHFPPVDHGPFCL